MQIRKLLFRFCEQQNKDVKNVTVNVDNIRQKLLNRDKVLPIKDPSLRQKGEFYDTKQNKRSSEYIFDFVNQSLDQKDGPLQVYGLQNGFFAVNELWYPGSIILFPTQIFLWEVPTAQDIRPHCFDILDVIKPRPNYIMIGTGRDMVQLPDSYFEKLRQMDIKVDIVPTFEACSNFNFCSQEGRDVCAFLIPSNL